MPISPRCGSTWWTRQRKSCASSVEFGALKPATRTLIGLRHAEAVLDGAVLAGGVHALQHDEDGPRVVGVEHRRRARPCARRAWPCARGPSPRRRARAWRRACARRGRPSSRGGCAWRLARSCIARTIRDPTGAQRASAGATSSMRLPNGSSTKARTTPGRSISRRVGKPAAASRASSAASAAGVAHAQGGVGLRRGRERLGDAHVQLAVAAGEPAAAAGGQRVRLLELGQTEQRRRRTRAPPPRSRRAPPPARGRCRRSRLAHPAAPGGNANGPRSCEGRSRYRVRDSNPCYRRERPAS